VSDAPTVSVVMPTYERREQLLVAIDALGHQRVDEPFEIVVVSDGSTDGSADALRALDLPVDLRVIEQDNAGPAAARNRGVEEASGDLIVFIDDDLVAGSGLLQAHVDAHRRLGPSAVAIGPMLRPPDGELQPWVDWEQTMLDKQYRSMEEGHWGATARQFYTGNASLARKHLVEAGGFDTSFRRAEDVELAYRLDAAGLTFEYLPQAVGYHHAIRSFEAWRSMAYTYGRNDVIFARDRGQRWIFPFMAEKWRQHQAPLRWLIAAGVRSRLVGSVLVSVFRVLAAATERLGSIGAAGWVGRAAYSAIYGVEYHRGIADELGSVDEFFTTVHSDEPVPR
jgi:GT2 family glycosyltransferase